MSPRIPAPDPALARALQVLAHRDIRPPCAAHPDAWYADDPDDRAHAARLCQPCPIRDVCATAGQQEVHGVWGGVDRTPTPKAQRVSQDTAATVQRVEQSDAA
jgi:hypothetical protein